MRLHAFLGICGLTMCIGGSAVGQSDSSAGELSPAEAMQEFRDGWDGSAWTQDSRGNPGYMRTKEDRGWQLRMQTLQRVVTAGHRSVPDLLESLRSGTEPERILAAQALGYLGPEIPLTPLLKAAKSDDSAAVRLYAVDAIGMRGVECGTVHWKALRKAESNAEVKKHIDYAIERDGTPLEPAVIQRLIRWDAASMSSAQVGKPAPDFTLTAATGETVRLSDFRGKKAVVLVFIYGDT